MSVDIKEIEGDRYWINNPSLMDRGYLRETDKILFSGSFNPLHSGHLNIYHHAKLVYPGWPFIFEISKNRCGKIDFVDNMEIISRGYLSLEERVMQFVHTELTVALTDLPTFVRKSTVFPKTVFCVGTDTIQRVNDLKYYYGSKELRDECIRKIEDRGCKFLVFPRNGESLDDLELCNELNCISDCILQYDTGFVNNNVSSTQIREAQQNNPLEKYCYNCKKDHCERCRTGKYNKAWLIEQERAYKL